MDKELFTDELYRAFDIISHAANDCLENPGYKKYYAKLDTISGKLYNLIYQINHEK